MSPGMNEFLDRFFMSRIAIRFLFQQHLTVFKTYIQDEDANAEDADPNARWVGATGSCPHARLCPPCCSAP